MMAGGGDDSEWTDVPISDTDWQGIEFIVSSRNSFDNLGKVAANGRSNSVKEKYQHEQLRKGECNL